MIEDINTVLTRSGLADAVMIGLEPCIAMYRALVGNGNRSRLRPECRILPQHITLESLKLLMTVCPISRMLLFSLDEPLVLYESNNSYASPNKVPRCPYRNRREEDLTFGNTLAIS